MLSREEYLSKIEIKSPLEAKKYLYLFRVIIILLTISFFTSSYFYKIENNIFWGGIFSFATVIIFSWFGYVYSVLKKKLNIPFYFSNVAKNEEKKYSQGDFWGNYWLASFLLRVVIGTADFSKGSFDPNKKPTDKLVKIVFNIAGYLLIILAIVIFIVLVDVVYYLIFGNDIIYDAIYNWLYPPLV